MRTYTTRTILDGGQAKEEDFNSEVMSSLSELNGQLDGNQLPLNEITNANLKNPTTDTTYSSLDGTYSSYMTTQSYHQSEWVQGGQIPKLEYNSNLFVGFSWIKLQALQTSVGATAGGAQITFNALEGMLAGCAVIDFNWFSGEAHFQSGGLTVYSNYGLQQVVEWGVFVDDVLVSKSGYIWPRELTLNLPYNTPVSSKPTVVDIRFRVQFIDPNTLTVYGGSVDVDTLQALTYKGGNLWCRNQHR